MGHQRSDDDVLAACRPERLAGASATELRALVIELERMARQLRAARSVTRVVEQAKGMLMSALQVDQTVAFDRLREHARNTGTTLAVVAQTVIRDGVRMVGPAADEPDTVT